MFERNQYVNVPIQANIVNSFYDKNHLSTVFYLEYWWYEVESFSEYGVDQTDKSQQYTNVHPNPIMHRYRATGVQVYTDIAYPAGIHRHCSPCRCTRTLLTLQVYTDIAHPAGIHRHCSPCRCTRTLLALQVYTDIAHPAGVHRHCSPFSSAGVHGHCSPFSSAGVRRHCSPFSSVGVHGHCSPFSSAGVHGHCSPFSSVGVHGHCSPLSSASVHGHCSPCRCTRTLLTVLICRCTRTLLTVVLCKCTRTLLTLQVYTDIGHCSPHIYKQREVSAYVHGHCSPFSSHIHIQREGHAGKGMWLYSASAYSSVKERGRAQIFWHTRHARARACVCVCVCVCVWLGTF